MANRDPTYMCEIEKDVYFLPNLLDFVGILAFDAFARHLLECRGVHGQMHLCKASTSQAVRHDQKAIDFLPNHKRSRCI